MAKLVIKKREDAKGTNGISLRDYDVTIDGNEISHMTGLSLTMNVDELNECTLKFFVGEVDVDADFLAAVEAHVKANKEKEFDVPPRGRMVSHKPEEEVKLFIGGKEVK